MRVIRNYDFSPVRLRSLAQDILFKRSEPAWFSLDQIWEVSLEKVLRTLSRWTRTRTCLLLVALASQRGFQLSFLARGHEKSMLLGVFDDLFSHHLPLETAQRAFDRFARVYIHDCH